MPIRELACLREVWTAPSQRTEPPSSSLMLKEEMDLKHLAFLIGLCCLVRKHTEGCPRV